MWSEVASDIDAVEEITRVEDLEKLRPEWWALWHESPSATPFQSPAWVLAWWGRFGGEGLWVLALRSEGRLIGLVPMFIWNRPDTSERTILLIGTGITDYLDAVFADGFEGAGAATLFEYLYWERRRWDVCDFQQLPATSALLTGSIGSGWSEDVTHKDVCPVLEIPECVTGEADFLPGKMWDNLRYYRRRSGKLGEVRIEPVSESNFDSLFDALLRLHTIRWEHRGQEGMFADRDVQAFHRGLAWDLLQHGLLRMYGLYLGDRIVACYYGMAAKRRAYYYLSGFDPAFAQLSPGTQIVGHAISEAVRERAVLFDFLRGREDYKYAWGASDHHSYRRQCWINAWELCRLKSNTQLGSGTKYQ